MMNQKEFFDYVASHLPEHLPEQLSDIEITQKDIVKHNDQVLNGLVLSSESLSSISPCIYLNDFFKSYQTGTNLNQIMEEIADTATNAFNQPFTLDMPDPRELISHYEEAKEHLSIHLCDTKDNMERLQDLVHTELSDYSMTYHVQLTPQNTPEQTASFAVTNPMLEAWGISKETLHQDSLLAQQHSQPILSDLESVMFQCMGLGTEPVNLLENSSETTNLSNSGKMYVLTNAEKMFGASLIVQEDILEKSADCLGGSFYILPSSVHELLLIPASEEITAEDLTPIVQEVNANEVSVQDRLSDKVQFYDSETEILENAMSRQLRLEQEKETAILPPVNKISYDIYQVRSDEDTHDVRFSSLQTLKHLQLPVESSNYEKVYSGSAPAMDENGNKTDTSEVLESLFEKFNLQHEYSGRF